MKKGFTLVELSIVLVIIGLLISGLLVGQSMIKAAKIQAQIKQVQEIQIALRNFHTTYKGLPGDFDKIGITGSSTSGQPATVCAGDNNKEIENNMPGTPTGNEAWGGAVPTSCNTGKMEFLRAFEHLAATEMYKWDLYDDSVNTSNLPGIAYPEMILDGYEPRSLGNKGGVVFGYESATSYVSKGHKIRIGACPGGAAGPTGGPTLNVGFYCGPAIKDMLAIDSKVDDGRPMTGDVVATADYYVYRIFGGPSSDQTTCCIDSGANSYKVDYTGSSNVAIEFNTDF